ncbi:IS4 family transposase [Anaeromyxobacter sp. PSR-1]|uniref:IS4 family transposase n=1 Tax=Anaeromyxobacter sp. PSR-1 TaxID=1300915 RepID=UPI000750B55F|nr:IS4 family transposase [Anaeromyxobacter sp. PSR-1]
MRVDRMLATFLGAHVSTVHKARVVAVFAAVAALVRGGEIALSRLGRAIAIRTTAKHGIKRIDRLYGNGHVLNERQFFYRGIAHGVLRDRPRPAVLVDWTEVGGGMRVLAAAAPCSGRAVIIYAEVHPLRHYANPRVEARFLRRLAEVLPPASRPIIVTDAGFRAPWIRQVLNLGWDFVARVRGRAYVRPAGGAWLRFDKLYDAARVKAKDLGPCLVTRYQPYSCRVVVVRKRRRWRAAQRRLALDSRERQEVQAAREPWVLATSIQDIDADGIVATYASRMQIEEAFRDAKSSRFGWAMEAACTARPGRVEVMVLLAALASLLILMVGISAEGAGLHRKYQANTISTRRVLALTTLGRLVLLHELAAAMESWAEFPVPPALLR